jgi:hypothetical protein
MMAKYKLGFLLILLSFVGLTPAKAQFWEVSLLTADPGTELYSSFGHSAIRMREMGPDGGRDLVFNFGTFDFDTPNFYGKFATGKLNYMLSVVPYDRFIVEYDYYKRGLREQVLDLNQEQKDFLLQHLDAQYAPERRFYKYDFFYNNCATKIRDAFDIAMGKQLVWSDSVGEEKTFRNLIDEFVLPLPWADFGIDLALGAVIDRPATELEKQFLPTYMEQAFANATIVENGVSRPLVRESRVLLEYPKENVQQSLLNPSMVFWLLTLVFAALTLYGFKKGKLMKGLDVALFGTVGILGIVVAFLWFFTDHSATAWNWNILWAFPGHLVLVWGLVARPNATWISSYLLFVMGATVMTLLLWIFGLQSFSPALIPILLLLLLRSNFLFYNRKKED